MFCRRKIVLQARTGLWLVNRRGVRWSGTAVRSTVAVGRLSLSKTWQIPKYNECRWSPLPQMLCRTFASGDFPEHLTVTLPALSPTMESGTIVKWEKEEGEILEEGDTIAQIETDKAVMDMETPSAGYLAKIIVPAGSKDLPLGKVLAIIVENESDVAAFKDYQATDVGTTPTTTTPTPPPPSEPTVSLQDFPEHSTVTLPALSPTMESGTIVKWEKEEGEILEEGDTIAQVETDKAVMDMETPSTGYLAKIIVPAGSKDLPLGKLLAIIVENESDIAAFKDYQPPADIGSPEPSPSTPTPPSPSPIPASTTTSSPAAPVTPTPSQGPIERIIASPYAKKLATEKGIDLQTIQGTGPSGRITSKDILKGTPSVVTPSVVAPPTTGFEDFPLSGMRKTIAARLLQSKQTIPHYYLSIDVLMDEVLRLRKDINNEDSNNIKISVNDFIVKASSLALQDIPEVNSSWMDSFVRRYYSSDVSVAVSTEGGLITPIIFNAESKGLKTISIEMRELAEKARTGRLQPHEFQGGTFTISNLGMYGIRNFSAVINPPQSCILAIGSTDRRLLVDDNKTDGYYAASVMSVTLSCDHRVVDGAVGAQWLAAFKSYLEKPFKMLL